MLYSGANGKGDKENWKDMLDYFKNNPDALLDAIPTPRNEEEPLYREFKSGTPVKKNLKLNDSMTLHRRNSSRTVLTPN